MPVAVIERTGLVSTRPGVGTPDALKVMERLGIAPFDLLLRHQLGDCSDAVTEADRIATTVLRPGEY